MNTNSHNLREAGSVMVLALLLTLFILGVGLTAMWISSSDTKISANITRRQEALNAAEAGLERARIILATSSGPWGLLLTTVNCGATKDDVGGRGRILCEGNPATVPMEDVPVIQGSAMTQAGLGNLRYTIYIRNDDAEAAANVLNGIPAERDFDQRVVVRVEATGRDALSYFALEAVIAAPVEDIDEDYMGQIGGSAQGTHSGRGQIPLPPP